MLSYAEVRRVWGKTENTSPSRFLKEIDKEFMDANFDVEELSGRNRWERAMQEESRHVTGSMRSRYGASHSSTTSRSDAASRPRPEIITTPRPLDPSKAGLRSVGVRSTEAVPQAATECGYGVGDRVEHPKFGRGTIERIESLTSDHKLVVLFDNYGSKTLLAKFAKLKKI